MKDTRLATAAVLAPPAKQAELEVNLIVLN